MDTALVIGNSIAGNLTAAYLRAHTPSVRVVVVGDPEAKRPTVGESLVEISTRLIRGIGLGDHLIREQMPKYALTYYYKLGGDEVDSEPEYLISEAPYIPPFPSFQLNRLTFDPALRAHNARLGVESVAAKAVGLRGAGGQGFEVDLVDRAGERSTRGARWVIDASGRGRFLARALGLHQDAPVQRDAFWLRLAGFDRGVLQRLHERAHKKENRGYDSYYVTHHFFGRGYWVWCIPLRSPDGEELISVGAVSRPDLAPKRITSLEAFLEVAGGAHPVLREMIEGGRVVDTCAYRNFMYECSQMYSPDGWFIVGDAAMTVDALYSTGLAITSIQITQVAEMIRRDILGAGSPELSRDFETAIRLFHRLATDDISNLYEVMHDPYQCPMRQHVNFLTTLHIGLPFMFNGYLCDPVLVKLWNRFAGAEIGRDPGADPLFQLIARVGERKGRLSPDEIGRIQSAFTMNYRYYERLADEDLGRSVGDMLLALSRLRARLLGELGVEGARWLSQHGELLKSVAAGVSLRLALGGRNLREDRRLRALLSRALAVHTPEVEAEPLRI